MTVAKKEVYNINWVNNIDPKKISLDKEFIPSTKRLRIKYVYSKKYVGDLYVATPFEEKDYVTVEGIKRDSYEGKDTSQYTAAIVLDTNNEEHSEFLQRIKIIVDKLQSGGEVTFPLLEQPDGHTFKLYAKLISDKSGSIFTQFYDSENVIDDPQSLGFFSGRVSLSFNISDKRKVIVQVVQAYVHNKFGFPLIWKK